MPTCDYLSKLIMHELFMNPPLKLNDPRIIIYCQSCMKSTGKCRLGEMLQCKIRNTNVPRRMSIRTVSKSPLDF